MRSEVEIRKLLELAVHGERSEEAELLKWVLGEPMDYMPPVKPARRAAQPYERYGPGWQQQQLQQQRGALLAPLGVIPRREDHRRILGGTSQS
jgi:hypothetical protein